MALTHRPPSPEMGEGQPSLSDVRTSDASHDGVGIVLCTLPLHILTCLLS
jgi:hypothetical protein